MVNREPPAWRNLKVGIFFLVSLSLLMAALFVVGTNAKLFQRKYELHIYLPNAQQLDTGSMVALAGLEVGKVKEIRLVPRSEGPQVQLTLSVPRSRQHQITESSVAQIRTIGVLGDRFIDISLGDPSEKPLAAGQSLPVAMSVDWPATLQRAAGALDDVLQLVEQGAKAVRKINEGEGTLAMLLSDPSVAEGLGETTRNLAELSRELRGGKGSFGRFLRDPTVAARLEGLLTRLERSATQLEEGDGLLARLLRDDETAFHFDRMVAGADSLVAELRGNGTAGRLLQDEALYEEMLRSSTELRALIADIKAHPDRYLDFSLF